MKISHTFVSAIPDDPTAAGAGEVLPSHWNADHTVDNDELTAALDVFVGDSGSGGVKGLVPAPAAGDATKFLKGNGTWATVSGGGGGGDAFVADGLDQFAPTTSAELATVITDETGTGLLVYNNGPTLVAPILGTPASGTLTNCTGLPLAGVVDSTSEALGVGTLELGHASDTTLARASAGQITVEGVAVLLSGGPLGTPSSGNASNLTGTATGLTAGNATVAATVTVADAAADTTTFPLLAGSATGNLPALTDAGLSYNASTNTLTAGFFVGDGAGITGIGGSGTVTHTGALTANQVVVGNGSSDIKILASASDATKFLNGAATPAYAQVKDSDLSTTDITTNNVSTTKHGFAPKLSNVSTEYLSGTGVYSTPAGGGGSGDWVSTLTSAEISITTTATATLNREHVCSGTSANYTVTLPTAVGNAGKFIAIRISNACTKLITIDGNGAETIDGAAIRVMHHGESCHLISDNVQWCKDSGQTIPMIARASMASSVTATAAAYTKVNATGTIIDNTGLMIDSSTNFRINIARYGTYRLTGRMIYIAITAAGPYICSLYANGANYALGYVESASGQYPTVSAFDERLCVAGDYVELYAAQYSASSQTVNGEYLSAIEIPQW